MLDMQSCRIRDLREIDFSKLNFEDLHWKYGTFQSTSTGSGRYKEYGSWFGVRTNIGEIEESVWYQAAEKLIRQKGEQEILNALFQWGSKHNYLRVTSKELRKDALRLHIDRIFEKPRWVDFVPFNRQYRPETLERAHLVTVINSCCGQPGEVTQEQIDAAYGDAIACPCCGRWSTFTIISDDSPESNQQSGEQQDRLEMT